MSKSDLKLALFAVIVITFLGPIARSESVRISKSKIPNELVTRCGWFDNPTASNAWLHDKDGEWVISIQAGYRSKGGWPSFNKEDESEFVITNSGSYGYGCVCLNGKFEATKKRVLKIVSSQVMKLETCRADKLMKEPFNPFAENEN